jgi:hypothetical protein
MEKLNVCGTEVSDSGMVHLSNMKNLKELYLLDSRVSKPAAEMVHARFPGAKVFGRLRGGETYWFEPAKELNGKERVPEEAMQ